MALWKTIHTAWARLIKRKEKGWKGDINLEQQRLKLIRENCKWLCDKVFKILYYKKCLESYTIQTASRKHRNSQLSLRNWFSY